MRRLLCSLVLLLVLIPALVAAQEFPPQVQKALDDLNARLGLELTLTDFNWRYSKNVYDDTSLGCPQPGFAYSQVLTPGFQVQLDVEGLTWDYRVSTDMSRVILCSPLATPTPTPLPTFPPPLYIIPTAAPGSTATPVFCDGAPALRLTVGGHAIVLPDVANIVRQAPGLSSGFLGELPVGREIYVLDGPRCASDMAWWYIADTQSRLVGWTSEGIIDPQALLPASYWLEPFPLGIFNQPTPTPLPTLSSGAFPTITPTGREFPTSMPKPPTPTPFSSSLDPTPTPGFAIAFPTNPPPPGAATTNAVVCSPNLPPRLVVGRAGRVTPGIPNNLRQGPGSSTPYIGEIPPGGEFSVLEGPTCASGLSWWKVNYNGTIGWTPEGIAPEYWVEPI